MEGARRQGATIRRADGYEPAHGYAVTAQNGPITAADDFFLGAPGEELGREIAADWLSENEELLDEPGMYIGIWPDKVNHEIVLDETELVSDRDEAIRLGIERDQQFICDLATGRLIPTGGTGGRQQEAASTSPASWPGSDGARPALAPA